MTNDQVRAANKSMNRYRATVKIETVVEGSSEVLTPYLIADPTRRGLPVTVTRETPASEVTRLFNESVRTIL